MTTFAQTIIHSKNAKYQRVNPDSMMGNVVKGTISNFGNARKNNNSSYSQSQIMKEIEVLPKSKLNIERKMKNKRVIPGLNKNEEIVLMESSVFPAVYYKKTSMRNVLKEFSFPENCMSLPPSDDRTTLIYQIISKLFNEINFYIFNILVGENLITHSYYIFFSDSQTIPFTKCCNAPVFIQLLENGSGKILCNAVNCTHSNLAQFLINFDDGHKLWKNIMYFAAASEKDRQLKTKISKLILNGKYKKRSLVGMVQETSQQIVDIFYESRNRDNVMMNGEHESEESPFLTAAQHNKNNEEEQEQRRETEQENEAEFEAELFEPEQKNLQILKMKLMCITKRQKNINKKLCQSIVQDSKVFHKEFDMIKRIDALMLKSKNSKTATRINFPRLMNQIKKEEERSSKAKSLYKSFG